jgi:hypothetical protein
MVTAAPGRFDARKQSGVYDSLISVFIRRPAVV